MTSNSILVFGDGACSGNPGPGGWGSIIVHPEGRVEELGGGARSTTNNQMELTAVLRGLESLRDTAGEVEVISDSLYVLRGISQWIWGWRKRGWKTAEGGDVLNREIWQALDAEVGRRRKLGQPAIRWSYVKGHAGTPGNERVDEIAVAFSKGSPLQPPLYRGSLLHYFVAIHDLPESREIPPYDPEKNSKRTPVPALAYVSVVNGVPSRHSTWKECEAHVKGRSGAKFKKVTSEAEEKKTWESWGVQPPKTPIQD